MKKIRRYMSVLLCCAFPYPALAAEPQVLHQDTPIRMRLNRTISSSDATVNETVDFETLDDVKLGDTIVIPKGSTALGTVTEAVSKRRMARGGKLSMNIDFVRLPNGEKLALRGIQEGKGGGHVGAMTGAMVATSVVFFPAAPLFLFMHGKDITIPKGHEVTVYTSTEFDISNLRMSPSAKQGLAARPEPMTVQSFTPSPAFIEPPPPPAPPALAADAPVLLRFKSDPASAEVLIDGEYWGSTPTSEIQMKPGPHTIAMKKRGFQIWERKVTLVPGDTRTVNAELEVERVDPNKPKIIGLEGSKELK